MSRGTNFLFSSFPNKCHTTWKPLNLSSTQEDNSLLTSFLVGDFFIMYLSFFLCSKTRRKRFLLSKKSLIAWYCLSNVWMLRSRNISDLFSSSCSRNIVPRNNCKSSEKSASSPLNLKYVPYKIAKSKLSLSFSLNCFKLDWIGTLKIFPVL